MKINSKRFGFIILLALVLVSCRKEPASWNSDWILPMVNDSLMIKNYLNDSTLVAENDNSLRVVAKRRLLNLNLTDRITFPDTAIVQEFAITFPYIELPPGFSFIDETKEYTFNMSGTELKEARIKEGTAKLRLENPISEVGIFNVSLPGVSKNGIEFSQVEQVEGGTINKPGIAEVEFDLSGYTVDLRGVDGSNVNILQFKLTIGSAEDADTIVLTMQHKFRAIMEFKDLQIDYARGYFSQSELTDTVNAHIEVLDIIYGGAINIDDASMRLVITNGIKARAAAKINSLVSTNPHTGSSVQLTHPNFNSYVLLNAAQGQWNTLAPSQTEIVFDNNVGNMVEFMENLGAQYDLDYSIEINPYGNTSQGNDYFYPNSRIKVDLEADFPLLVGADNLILQDTFAFSFKNDNKALRIKEGKLILKTVNTFPYGAEIKLSLLDEEKQLIKEISSVGTIAPAPTNASSDGHIPTEETIEFILDEAAADGLKDSKFILVKAKLNSTTFTNNVIYDNAAIKFLLQGQFKLRAKI